MAGNSVSREKENVNHPQNWDHEFVLLDSQEPDDMEFQSLPEPDDLRQDKLQLRFQAEEVNAFDSSEA